MYRLVSFFGCFDNSRDKTEEFTSIANGMTAEEFLALPSDYHRHLVTAYCHTEFRQSLSQKLDLDRMNINKASIVLKEGDIGVSTIANRDIKEGENILTLRGPLLSKANVFTIQVDHDVHMMPTGGCEFLAHSCNANTKLVIEKSRSAEKKKSIPFDVEKSLPDLIETMNVPEWWNADAAPVESEADVDAPSFVFQDEYALHVVAIKDISKGEVVAFNYLTSEYSMAEKFECRCAGTSEPAEVDGLPQCFGDIQGFKHLSESHKDALRPLCTSIVLDCEKIDQEN